MSLTSRAFATTIGDPVLKLVLLAVATAPGYPAVKDVAAGAELPPDLTEDALNELIRRRLLVAHKSPGSVRYELPEEDGWLFESERDSGAEVKAATPLPPTAFGMSLGGARLSSRGAR